MSKKKTIKAALLILSALLTAAQQIDKQEKSQEPKHNDSIPNYNSFSENDVRL